MTSTSRRWLSISIGLVGFLLAFLIVMAWGCDDVDGVPSWERCTSAMGTPAFSVEDWGLNSTLNIFIPVVSGLVVGFATSWLSRQRSAGGK